jgi:hypothetical protein
MDRRAALLALADSLRAAGAAADWEALAKADAALAPALAALAARGPWRGPERLALQALREAHEQARQRCAQAKTQLGEHLHEMRENKEGWIAYALYSETDPNGNDA